MGGHAGRAVAEEYDDTAAVLPEAAERGVHGFCPAENVANDVGAMQARQHVLAVADAAVHERHVLHLVVRRHVGVALQRADFRRHRKFADSLDELFPHLAIGNELGDRDLSQFVFLRKGGNFWPTHHRTIVVHQFGEHADRRQ